MNSIVSLIHDAFEGFVDFCVLVDRSSEPLTLVSKIEQLGINVFSDKGVKVSFVGTDIWFAER
jgi:hypothetical protein